MTGRVSELDGLRGWAVLLVVVWHYVSRSIALASPDDPVSATVLRWTRLTWSGVDLFFVLSGFLIGGILFRHRKAGRYFSTFYVRRACRILPLYFALVLSFGIGRALIGAEYPWLFEGALPMSSYLTFTQNLVMGWTGDFGANGLGVTWSLAIEEHFYLVIPLLIRLLPERVLVASLIMLCAAGPIVRSFLSTLGAYVYTFARTDGLLIGVLLAWLLGRPERLDALVRGRRWIALGLIPTVAVGIWFTLEDPRFGRPLVHLFLAGAYSLTLLSALVYRGHRATAPLRWRWLRWLGLRSYGIYLLHQPVAGLVYGSFHTTPPTLQDARTILVNLLCWVTTFAVAESSFRFLEGPFLRYGHAFSYSSR